MSFKFLKRLSIWFLVMLGISSICFAGTDAMPVVETGREQQPFFVGVFRHGQTESNQRGETHGTSGGKLTADSFGEEMSSLSDFAGRYSGNIQGLYCGTDVRHYSTLSTIALKTGQEVQKMQNFDEFNLGILKGLSEQEVQKRPEFLKIFMHPDQEVPGGDSIDSVKKEFIEGLGHVVREAIRGEKGGISMICTSRITMNIALRYLLRNDKFLNPKIPNCGAYIFKYTPCGDELASHQVHPERFELLNSEVEILNGDTVIPGVEALDKSVGTPLRDHDKILQEFAKQHSITGLTSVTPALHVAQPDETSPTSELKDEEKEIVVARTEDGSDSEVISDSGDSGSENELNEGQYVDQRVKRTELADGASVVLPVARRRVKLELSDKKRRTEENSPSLELRKGMVTSLRLDSPFGSLNSGLSFNKAKNLKTWLSHSQGDMPLLLSMNPKEPLNYSHGDLPVVVPVDSNEVRRYSTYLECLSPVNFTPTL